MSFNKDSMSKNQSMGEKSKNESSHLSESNFDFLASTYRILRTLEKEPNEQNQRVKQSQIVNNQLEELQKKFNSARSKIMKIPGIELSKEDQLKKLEKLHKSLEDKKQLISKYRNMANSDKI